MNNNPQNQETGEQVTSQKAERSWINGILSAAVLILAIVLTAMLTFSITVNRFWATRNSVDSDGAVKFQTVAQLMDSFAFYSPDQEQMVEAALKAYVGASGDRYTVYYNAEEYEAIEEKNKGRYIGIGITIQEATVQYLGKEICVLEVVRVADAFSDGPCVGDYIYAVNTDKGIQYVDEVGQDVFSELVRGEEGTTVKLLWLSASESGLVLKEAELVRREVFLTSAEAHISETSPDVGIVSIYRFDQTTPSQFCAAIDDLKEKGIGKIVLDLRDNGGGDLISVIACASYFLEKGDVIITVESKDGVKDDRKAVERIYTDNYKNCSVTESEIGKYRDLKVAVLVNENTASAAELLTAVFRDYNLAPIVGAKTYGKGSMQTLISLAPYGFEGGVKMTTHLYYPPSGQGYNGIGIIPDIAVESSEDFTASVTHESKDLQLVRAIEELVKQ